MLSDTRSEAPLQGTLKPENSSNFKNGINCPQKGHNGLERRLGWVHEDITKRLKRLEE